MHDLVLATSFLDPIVNAVAYVINLINVPLHSLGWSLVAFALLVRLAFWKLNTAQFKTMVGMQKIGPRLKALKTKYAGDAQGMQQAQMALYKDAGVNPAAGCLPMLIQLPIIISVYYAVRNNLEPYKHAGWVWIGTPLAQKYHTFLATNLAAPDIVLLGIYIVTMYLSIRYTSMPSTDPAQAQTQKIMQIFSPAMIAYVGFRAQWPSAMILYWISLNVFTMAQQVYLLRKYHQPLSVLDSEHAIVDDEPAALPDSAAKTNAGKNGSRSRRSRRRSRR